MSSNFAIVPGSVLHQLEKRNVSITEALLDVELVAVCDRSGSMDDTVFPEGRTKMEILRDKLAQLQAQYPGKVLVYQFDMDTTEVLNGVPGEPRGGTAIAQALRAIKDADALCKRLVLLSDGEPGDSEQEIFAAARELIHPIDCIFIGEEGDRGAAFMRRLSQVKQGGTYSTEKTDMNLLVSKLAGFLGTGK